MKKLITATMLAAFGMTMAAAATEANLYSLTVHRGSSIGSIELLRLQDGRPFTVRAVTGGFDWSLIAGAHVTAAATHRIDIRVRAQKNSPGSVGLHLFDWRLNRWVHVAPLNFGLTQMTTSTVTISTNASRWVVPGGSIRVRFVALNGTMFTDQVRITVN
ncbi:MAG: hypothetical protein K1X67_19335 [Fimbriimonadaceae bacterium]|nr:hypothetical protein [Fimbriimonadaceae bacterium]